MSFSKSMAESFRHMQSIAPLPRGTQATQKVEKYVIIEIRKNGIQNRNRLKTK